MQPMERKRQGYIHELIQTEERYMDDLQLVLEVRCLHVEVFGKTPPLSLIIAVKRCLRIVKCWRNAGRLCEHLPFLVNVMWLSNRLKIM